jgi:hypothetical protein
MRPAKNYLHHLLPSRLLQVRLHRAIFLRFAARNGFVYFGSIDQHYNTHRLVRGLTLSSTHRDANYCLGSQNGYDITFVERTDTLRHPGAIGFPHTWTILAIDLKSDRDIPHMFLANSTHGIDFYRHLFTKFSYLTNINIESADYPRDFIKQRVLYTSLRDKTEVEQIITPVVAATIHDNFGSLTFEIHERVLYLYAEHQRPSMLLLSRMLTQGLWMANVVDTSLD